MTERFPERIRWLVAAWAVGGVVLLLIRALWRLTPLAVEPWIENQLQPWQMAAYVGWLVFNAYAEGYRGFQKNFAPRVVARALHLARNPFWPLVVLAPLHAMALIHASRKRLLISWGLVAGIVTLVVAIHFLPQPYRGIIDGGVVIGLAWGMVTLVVYSVQAVRGRTPAIGLDLPDAPAESGA